MKYWQTLSIVILAAVCLTGCLSEEAIQRNRKKAEADDKRNNIERVIANAPTGAFDIQDMGNGWWKFSLTTDGKTRQFLWQKYGVSGDTVEILTEISPSDTPAISGSNQ